MLKKGDAEFSSTGVLKATGNRVRKVPSKPAHTKITPYVKSNLITVKFVEGSEIRLRKGAMTSMTKADMSVLDSFNANFPKGKWKRLFRQSEDELTKAKKHGEERTGWQLADLNLYFRFELPEGTYDNSGGINEAEAIIDALNAMDIVEIAYPEPIPEDPGPVGDIPPTTPDFTGLQGYLGPAPAGLDADYSWQFDGGAGYGSSFIDIEQGWDVCHEDLDVDSSDVLAGTNVGSDHGTAVLGEVIGYDNGYGVTGIAHQANAQMVSYVDHGSYPDIAAAINTAAANLSPGDLILIEAHAHGPDEVPYQCTCNCTQYEYIPMEYWQANFDAIQTAVANGIIVVEAGGNGSMDLDHERYDNRFDRLYRDSGAILVGAATSSVPHQPMCWTNYGSRIDVYAWGENVMTTGYGYHFDSGTDDCQDYRATFGGTSSASPMIVGAAANIQGILRARGDSLLSPAEMRAILANNGTDHDMAAPVKPIGVMPDLRQAIPAALGINGNVLCFNPAANEEERIRSLGYKVTTTGSAADLTRTNLQNYDLLWIGASTDPATYSAYNSQIRSWVYFDGGGVVVEQPNRPGSVSLFPWGYEVSINSTGYNSSGNAVITNGKHPITKGLSDGDLSGNFDKVYDTDIGNNWWILARDATESDLIALLAAYYGLGRFVYHNGHISTRSIHPGSDPYVRQMIDWAANLGPTIALVETGTSVSNSVINALNEMDRKFDFFDTSDFSDISFNGYDALIQKPIGNGHLNWFINCPSSWYWSDTDDYNLLKTIIRNMLMQGVDYVYHSPSSSPRGLAYRYYSHLYNCDDDDNIYDIRHYNGALINTFSSPGRGLPLGLAYDGQYLWNADMGTDMIYKLNSSDMSVVDSFACPRNNPADIAYGGGYLWAAILQSGPIIKIDPDTGMEVDSVEVPTGSRPFGLTWVDGYLYVGDTNKDLIYKIDPRTDSVVSAFPSPGGYPAGLAFDGSYFWVSDFYDDAIYKLSLQSDTADVRITSITFNPPSPVVNENITVSVTVRNSGSVATPGFYVDFYRNIDHRPEVYEYSSDFWWVNSLDPGEQVIKTKIIRYSSPGTYSTGAFADTTNRVDEGIYGDNNAYWPRSLTVTNP